MINGLDRFNYDHLTGLVNVECTSINTEDIKYDEILTLNNIDTTKTIQTQLNDIKTIVDNITISGSFIVSNFVLLSYLQTYYFDNEFIVDNYYDKIDSDFKYATKTSLINTNTTLNNTITDLINTNTTLNNTITTLNNTITNLNTNYYNQTYINNNFVTNYTLTNDYMTRIFINDNFYSRDDCDAQFVTFTYVLNYYTRTEANTTFYNQTYINNNFVTNTNLTNNYFNRNYILDNYFDAEHIESLFVSMGYLNNNVYKKVDINDNFYNKAYIDTLSGTVFTLSGRIHENTLNIITLTDNLNGAQSTANTANSTANYCKDQIDRVGTLSLDLFGNQIGDPPSALNQRIKDAKASGDGAAATVAIVGATVAGLGVTIAGISTAVGVLQTEVTGLTTNVIALNNVTRYMSTSIFAEGTDYTKFTSGIKFNADSNAIYSTVFISNKYDVLSYFDNNVEFRKDVTVTGSITNTALNNNISTISGLVKTANDDITSNST